MKDQSDQGEGKGYVQHFALQETTKDDGNRATTLLCYVDELISCELVSQTKLDAKLIL